MCCGLSSLRYKNRVLEKMRKRTFISILEDQRHNHKPPEGVPSACREISLQSCNSFMCACLCVCVYVSGEGPLLLCPAAFQWNSCVSLQPPPNKVQTAWQLSSHWPTFHLLRPIVQATVEEVQGGEKNTTERKREQKGLWESLPWKNTRRVGETSARVSNREW